MLDDENASAVRVTSLPLVGRDKGWGYGGQIDPHPLKQMEGSVCQGVDMANDTDFMSVTETPGKVIITYRTRNRLVMVFGIMALVGILGMALAPLVTALQQGALVSSVVILALLAVSLVAAGKLFIARRTHQLVFTSEGLSVGGQTWRFDDITDHGLNQFNSDPAFTSNVGAPANVTIGWHIHVDHKGRHVPVTIGLPEKQARALYRAFSSAFERYKLR